MENENKNSVKIVSGYTTGSVVAVSVTNLISKVMFVGAMCYCLHTGHWKFAVACLVAAVISGMSIEPGLRPKKS